MILSNNAFNWAMLRSGMGTGDFMASLTPEREAELFKQYNEWRKERGLPEEKAPSLAPSPTPAPVVSQAPIEVPEDDLSAMFTQVAAEVEEEKAEEAALVQNALDGADEIVEEEAAAPVPDEIVEELEEEPEEADEPVPEDAAPMDAAPEVVTTPAAEAVADAAAPAADFATIIRSLPKEPDPALYSHIKAQYGEETKSMAQAALKEATAKHRGTAAIRAFLAWLEQKNED